jgi:uncharacterized membrane protein YsdA (DUF1294 family)/cold shock CspA family protein
MESIILKTNTKGYGFILDPVTGSDLFFHFSDFGDDKKIENKDIRVGLKVVFDTKDTKKGKQAINIKPVQSKKHFSPQEKFLAVFVVLSVIGFSALAAFSSFSYVYAYMASINIAAFVFIAYDKGVAGSGQLRVPESILHTITAIGGSVASTFAMAIFRHKTRKPSFLITHWAIILVQAGLAYFLLGI